MRISDWSSDVCSSDLLLGVLAQREGDVVEDVHRAEQGAVLEQHAELAPDPVQVPLPHRDRLLTVDPDLTVVGPQQADDVLEQHRLAGAGRAHHRAHLAPGDVEGDVLEDRVRSEEHTSELQSLMSISYAVFCLKKKTQ